MTYDIRIGKLNNSKVQIIDSLVIHADQFSGFFRNRPEFLKQSGVFWRLYCDWRDQV